MSIAENDQRARMASLVAQYRVDSTNPHRRRDKRASERLEAIRRRTIRVEKYGSSK